MCVCTQSVILSVRSHTHRMTPVNLVKHKEIFCKAGHRMLTCEGLVFVGVHCPSITRAVSCRKYILLQHPLQVCSCSSVSMYAAMREIFLFPMVKADPPLMYDLTK